MGGLWLSQVLQQTARLWPLGVGARVRCCFCRRHGPTTLLLPSLTIPYLTITSPQP